MVTTQDLFGEAMRDVAAQIVEAATEAMLAQLRTQFEAYLAEQQQLDRQMVERISQQITEQMDEIRQRLADCETNIETLNHLYLGLAHSLPHDPDRPNRQKLQ